MSRPGSSLVGLDRRLVVRLAFLISLGSVTAVAYNLTKRTDPEVSLGMPSARQDVVRVYDSNGDRTRAVDALGVEQKYFYSDKNQLTKRIVDGAGDGLQTTRVFRYDSHGRLTQFEDSLSNTVTYEYDRSTARSRQQSNEASATRQAADQSATESPTMRDGTIGNGKSATARGRCCGACCSAGHAAAR